MEISLTSRCRLCIMIAREKGGGAVDEKREELAREMLRLLPLLFRRIFQTSRRTVLPELPPTQLQTLMLLERMDGPACMTWLAEELRISRQQFTKVANALEERGFAKREQSHENRRTVFLTLTEEGKQALADVLRGAVIDLGGSLCSYTDEELDMLSRAISILQSHLGKDRREENE